ncbi:MAG: beta-propeller domain-containing protein, partial [Verrucomicrobiales bacterium]|nr:beta-propeller domain-containing protein [Verrucomicrobiales bacterium]
MSGLQLEASEFQPTGYRGDDRAVVVELDEGTRRVRLQVRDEDSGERWRTVNLAHLDGRAGHVKLRLPAGVGIGDVRCEVSMRDPFPYSYYTGETEFSEVADQPNPGGGRGLVNGDVGFGGDAAAEGPAVAVEESDIWKWRGRTLYFFNTYRGLQVFDLSEPSAPEKVAALRMPAVGEQMYLVGDEHVVLLANRYDYYGSGTTGSEVVVVHHGESGLEEVERFQVEGSFVESRLVGDRLYTVTRLWEQVEEEPGKWSVRSGLRVYAYDFGEPGDPVPVGELELMDDEAGYYYNAVVTATPDYLFVTPATYDREAQSWESEVFVIGIGGGEALEVDERVRLAGQMRDKFKLRESGGVLTTVSQVRGREQALRTMVETFRLGGGGERLDAVGLAPGETLRATRFDGDRLYVVTFRQVDPLFLVDLSEPSKLRVVSELEVPGWSNYLEPMAEGERLLSVGVEERRVAVSLFDVSEASELSMVERVYLGEEGDYSWTEANYNEKAVGFFEGEGLLVLPFSGYEDGAYRNQMQLVDVGVDGLVNRGVVRTEFNARRSKLLGGETLVAVSGRVLRVVDVADRDAPQMVASLSIAWPAERLLSVGDRVWQFESGSYSWWDEGRVAVPATVRVTPADALDSVEAELRIGGGGQIAGAVAAADGGVVYVLTTRTEGQETVDEGTGEVLRWEYESVLTTHVIAGGAVVGTVEVRLPERWYYGSFNGAFLPGGELIWTPDSDQGGGYWRGCLACDFGGGIAGDVAFPYYGSQSGQVVVVDVEDAVAPEVVASFGLAGDGGVEDGVSRSYEFGEVFLEGERLRYGYREWWWSGKDYGGSHSVREVDLGVPGEPVIGEPVGVPGMLRHVVATSAGGVVLLTTRERVEADAEGRRVWTGDEVIEASAFDGVQAFLLDQAVAVGGASTAVAGWGNRLFKSARWSWWRGDTEGEDGVRVFAWDEEAGELDELPLVELRSSPMDLATSEGLLFCYRGGGVDVLGLGGLAGEPGVESFESTALGSYWWSAPPVEVVEGGGAA